MRYPRDTKVSPSFPLIFSRSYVLHQINSYDIPRNSSPLHHRSIEDRAKSAVSIVMTVIVANRPSVSHRPDEQSSKLRNHRANTHVALCRDVHLVANYTRVLLSDRFSRVVSEKVMSRTASHRSIFTQLGVRQLASLSLRPAKT